MTQRTSSMRRGTGDIELETVAANAISNGVQASASSRAKLLTFPWDTRQEQHNMPSYVEELEGVAEWVKQTRDSCMSGAGKLDFWSVLGWLLPCTVWLRTYDLKKFLVWDLLAGISVGFMVVPQAMSYANLAGVPSVFGLYGAFLPVMVYALFGSSKQLGVGPVAVTSMLIGNGIRGMVPGSEHIDNPSKPAPEFVAVQADYNRRVIELAFIVACMYTGVGVLRLGFLVRFLSHSVITGFTSGAAIIIGMSQVRYIFGYKVPRVDTLHESIKVLLDNINKFQWKEFVMGMSMIWLLVALKMLAKRYKKAFWISALGPISACVIGIVAVVAGNLQNKGIKIVENIPKGLPKPTVDQWVPVKDVGPMLTLAVIVMLVDLLESTSIARALARKNGYELSYNQEIVGLGIANFAGAAFSSYTTTGSFSRSAVNNASGAKTQLAGFITSLVVMFVLLFLTPVFEKLPYNTMAAIIIVGVAGLVEFEEAIYLFKTHLRDFLVWITAFICTLFLGIELGLGISIGLAMLIVIFESAFPHTAMLGRIDKSTVYRNVEQYPAAELTPGVLAVRLDAPVYFANVQWMQDKLGQYEAAAATIAKQHGLAGVQYVVLDLTPVSHMDSMGAKFVEQMHQDYKERGVQLLLSNPSPRVVRLLQRAGVTDKLGREWIFVRVHDAIQYCQATLLMELGEAPEGTAVRATCSAARLPGVGSAGSDGIGNRA